MNRIVLLVMCVCACVMFSTTDVMMRCAGETVGCMSAAAADGNTELVKVLLDGGGNPNEVREGAGLPLHRAAAAGHVETVELLLSRGARPEQNDHHGRTAMAYPFLKGDVDMVRLLCDGLSSSAKQRKWRLLVGRTGEPGAIRRRLMGAVRSLWLAAQGGVGERLDSLKAVQRRRRARSTSGVY